MFQAYRKKAQTTTNWKKSNEQKPSQQAKVKVYSNIKIQGI